MSSTTISLECWLYGDDPNKIFKVKIQKRETFGDLAGVIWEKISVKLRDRVNAKDLCLYSIPSPSDEDWEATLRSWLPQRSAKLNPRYKLSTLPDAASEQLIIIDPGVCLQSDLELWCLFLRNEPDKCFMIQIARTARVYDLKKLIKQEEANILRDIDANFLELYKVSLPIKEKVDQELDPENLLSSANQLSDVFSDPPPDRIHVLVSRPPPSGTNLSLRSRLTALPTDLSLQENAEDDMLTALTKSFLRSTTITSTSVIPSQAAKSSEYIKIPATPLRLLDCRYSVRRPVNTVAPPIQSFNPAFAYLSSKAFDPNFVVPNDVIIAVRNLMTQFTLPNEDARRRRLQPYLEKTIQHPLISINNFDRTTLDSVALCPNEELQVYLIVGKEKNEFGDGGSDPSVQAAFSFQRIFGQNENADLCLRSNCPTFLIAHAGPWLMIMGGIITANCVVQRLTDFLSIPTHSTHDKNQHRIARIFYALKKSIEKLGESYKEVHDVPAFDPSAPTSTLSSSISQRIPA